MGRPPKKKEAAPAKVLTRTRYADGAIGERRIVMLPVPIALYKEIEQEAIKNFRSIPSQILYRIQHKENE